MDMFEKLSKAVAIPTVSYSDRSLIDFTQYERFLAFLPEAFPKLFEMADMQRVADHSLLLHLSGSDKSKKPILFLAHYDVVPPGESDEWRYPPFEGRVVEDSIWGRGSLDNKGTLVAILQALEEALQNGWKPSRSVYFASGHDEEIGGGEGAKNIAAYFQSRQISLHAVYDEGMTILKPELFPIVDRNMALIGTSEKGHVDIEISAAGRSGHSSMPPDSTAAGIIAKAVTEIEKNPFPARIIGPVAELLRNSAPYTKGLTRLVLRNPALWSPLIKRTLQASDTSNALVRTTQAVTMLQGSKKENVLPQRASAVVNCRILPGETIEDVIQHLRLATSGLGVEIRRIPELEGNNPLPISSTTDEGYLLLESAISEVYTDTAVGPSIVLATTDSRHFLNVSENIYRFVPVVLDKELLASIHSSNERMPVESLEKAVQVYRKLIERL